MSTLRAAPHSSASARRTTAPSIALVSRNGFSFGPAGNIARTPQELRLRRAGRHGSKDVRSRRICRSYLAERLFRLRAELLKGIGGHEGLVGTIGADKIWRDGDRYVFSIGPRVLFSDARYQRAYFGVTPAASLASGLPAYRPGGGVHAVALASGLSYQLNNRWGLFGYARYERLVGDAAKSPIVRELGSRNQLSGGIGLNYTFTIRRELIAAAGRERLSRPRRRPA